MVGKPAGVLVPDGKLSGVLGCGVPGGGVTLPYLAFERL